MFFFFFFTSSIAAIKQTLGLFTESIDEYKLILSRDSEYVPALKGERSD